MARKASHRKPRVENPEFTESNVFAITQGARKKSWTVLDIKNIKPLNDPQATMIESFYMGNHIVADGSAGTGKTYIALWLALNAILSKEYNQNKIIIVRSNVGTGKDVGALPGELEDKMAPFEAPYKDILHDLLGKASSYDDMKAVRKIEFMPTTFIRGLTWDNAIIIVDEVQNMNIEEITSVMTRVGKNSKIFVIGDRRQNDLLYDKKTPSGFDKFMQVANLMDELDIISFTRNDIVRSGFVKSFICACEEAGI
jgi:phosphate starvation-inducible PhoH-like protein